MTIGLVGRKSGMTRVFTEDGASVPVTVVEIAPNRVTQIKELETDGYRAIQVTAGSRKASKVSKPEAGHFAKAGVVAGAEVAAVRARLAAGGFPLGLRARRSLRSIDAPCVSSFCIIFNLIRIRYGCMPAVSFNIFSKAGYFEGFIIRNYCNGSMIYSRWYRF